MTLWFLGACWKVPETVGRWSNFGLRIRCLRFLGVDPLPFWALNTVPEIFGRFAEFLGAWEKCLKLVIYDFVTFWPLRPLSNFSSMLGRAPAQHQVCTLGLPGQQPKAGGIASFHDELGIAELYACHHWADSTRCHSAKISQNCPPGLEYFW